jgi:hypothetical protein
MPTLRPNGDALRLSTLVRLDLVNTHIAMRKKKYSALAVFA